MHGVRHLINKESGHIKDYTIVLSTRSHVHLGQLKYITDINYSAPMIGAKELSFTVHWSEEPIVSEYYDLLVKEEITEADLQALIKKEKEIWEQIDDLKFVWVKELNEYFEIKVRYTDAEDTIKAITATSACEAELGQLMLYNMEINTELDIEIKNPTNNSEKVNVTTFYNEENYKLSLLHRILSDKAPHYSIKHVDASLRGMQRTFSIDGTSIYDFLTGECAEQFNCVFVFDSVERSISAYDLYTVCKDDNCRYRGDFTDKCPKCGGTDLQYFGEDTLVYVDKENLTNEVVFETNTDSIKNCFKLEAGDDDITTIIRDLNQNGTDYIYYISEQQKRDMPQELVEKIESYDELYASYTEEYQEILAEYYEAVNQIGYYEHSMMPDARNDKVEISAETEAENLRKNLSIVALNKITESTSTTKVENTILNFARLFVKTGYVKLEITDSEFTYNKNGNSTWKGKFKVTNYSDEEDVFETSIITVTLIENYPEWLENKVKNHLSADDDDGSVLDVLALDDLEAFKSALQEYSLERLKSFHSALDGAIVILKQEGHGAESSYLHEDLYLPYVDKWEACGEEIDIRNATIVEWKKVRDEASAKKAAIQKKLNFKDYLGNLYPIFCAYRRDEKYSNSNFVSDGLDDAEKIQKAKDFIEKAKHELEKAATHQHTISTTLQNLLLIPEFEPLLDKFALGNWIRVGVGKDVYRLRLIKYGINFNNLNTIDIEFSDLTKTQDVSSDVKDILSSAQSMSTSYSYVSKQASKGNDAQATIRDWVSEGLNSAQVVLKNNQNEDITIDRNGILCKSRDDLTEKYSPKQMRITGNMLAFTSDNWRTVSCALGEHDYWKFENGERVDRTEYGLTSKFVTAGVINGSDIIGGDIYSENYSSTVGTHINLNDGSFSFAGGLLKYNSTDGLQVEGVINAKKGEIGGWAINEATLTGGSTTLNADGSMSGGSLNAWEIKANGNATFNNLTAKNADIEGTIKANDGTMSGLAITGSLLLNGGYLTTSASRTSYNQKAKGMTLDANGIGGYDSDTACWSMSSKGILTAAGATLTNATVTGTITATKGTIGGCTISDAGQLQVASSNIVSLDAGKIKTGTLDSNRINGNTLKIKSGAKIATWDIDSNSIYSYPEGSSYDKGVFICTGTGSSYIIGGSSSQTGWMIGAGGNFGVTTSGALYCTSAHISGDSVFTGTVYANDGEFKGTVYASGGEFNGTVYASDGEFTGKINATKGGEIGGWQIGDKTLQTSGMNNSVWYSGKCLYADGFQMDGVGKHTNIALCPKGIFVEELYGTDVIIDYITWRQLLAKVNNL